MPYVGQTLGRCRNTETRAKVALSVPSCGNALLRHVSCRASVRCCLSTAIGASLIGADHTAVGLVGTSDAVRRSRMRQGSQGPDSIPPPADKVSAGKQEGAWQASLQVGHPPEQYSGEQTSKQVSDKKTYYQVTAWSDVGIMSTKSMAHRPPSRPHLVRRQASHRTVPLHVLAAQPSGGGIRT